MKPVVLVSCLFVLLHAANARKGGKKTVDPNIVNPDTEGPKKSLEFNKGFVEGDMIVSGGNSDDRNAVKYQSRHWIAGVVPYEFDDTLSSSMRYKVEEAIKDFATHTCIMWVKRLGEDDYVNINSKDSGCYANLGKRGGEQPLNLQEGGWFTAGCGAKGTIIHEMLHSIGFAHEQSRNDRDDYITVHWDNIQKEYHSQFRKLPEYQENNQGFPYDYSSVMHYPDWAFGLSGTLGLTTKTAITTKDESKQSVIGQREGFSKQDIEEVNKLYECQSNKIKQPDNCKDEWYVGDCRQKVYDWGTGVCKKDHEKSIRDNCHNTCRVCRA